MIHCLVLFQAADNNNGRKKKRERDREVQVYFKRQSKYFDD